MEENNNNEQNENREHYSESTGTGVLSGLIFTIIAFVAMYFLSKWMGN